VRTHYVHRGWHVCVFVVVRGRRTPFVFPMEVRPPCGSSSVLSLVEHGSRWRSAQPCQPAPEVVAVATDDFCKAVAHSYETSVSRAGICGHLGVSGHKQSRECKEKKGHEVAYHQPSYIPFLSKVMQVDIHL
jgi:hypothetical protein